ncbi:MAG TPA: type II CAAX endopeptidase family protein [Pyrinomonadaceae bacterium]|nr:type II CAAX endopeptidase family protein [Pyrinomonadaceae bacterium]
MENPNEISPDEGFNRVESVPVLAANPTPDNPPWNAVVAVLAWIASVVLIALVPILVLLPYIISRGPSFSERIALAEFLQKDPTSIILQIGAIIPAHILTLALAWAIVTKLNRFSFRETLGWNSGGMGWPHYAGILVIFFGIAMIVGNYFPEQENELTRILHSSRWAVYLVAFMATFTAPIVEEVIYRGILYSAFQRTFGVAAGIVIVTLLFALVHVPQYYPSFSTIFLLLLLSLILTLVRQRTGNLLPCIILHTIFNGMQSILLILEPYLKSEAPVIEPTTGFFLK